MLSTLLAFLTIMKPYLTGNSNKLQVIFNSLVIFRIKIRVRSSTVTTGCHQTLPISNRKIHPINSILHKSEYLRSHLLVHDTSERYCSQRQAISNIQGTSCGLFNMRKRLYRKLSSSAVLSSLS